MRRPKHRRHPDIWRARHLARELAARRWWDRGIFAGDRAAIIAAHDFWRAVNDALLGV